MSTIAFYGGIILILFGLAIWFFRPSKTYPKNSIKFSEFTFDFTTPEFIIVTFGIVLMVLSPKFPDHYFPEPKPVPPPPGQNYITVTSSIYQSRWRENKINGNNSVLASCNNRTDCQYSCNNNAANYGDPDKGAPKVCKITYICSHDPNNTISIKVDENENGKYDLKCTQPIQKLDDGKSTTLLIFVTVAFALFGFAAFYIRRRMRL